MQLQKKKKQKIRENIKKVKRYQNNTEQLNTLQSNLKAQLKSKLLQSIFQNDVRRCLQYT